MENINSINKRYEEYWNKMVICRREAVEDFNDDFEDNAILYAANLIKQLQLEIIELKESK